MLSRRTFSLASLAVVGSAFLVGCGDSSDGGGQAGGSTKLRLVSSDLARSPGDAGALPAAVASVHALGAGLWGQLAADDNLALSPYSVAVALGMTVNGAVGATRSEMLDVLGAASAEGLNGGLNALTQHVESLASKKVRLDSANQLFGQQDVPWERAFLDTLATDYGAGLRTVDFVGATEAARTAVNRWTADRTHDRIEEILPAGSVDRLTRLVLVNALYFKAPWLVPFEKALTADADFHLADGTVVAVPTMHAALDGAAYATGDGWESVRIPYAGGELAMTVVLPAAGREVEVDALPAILAAATPSGVELSLPRWTFRTEVSLAEALAALGMPTAFDEIRADFTEMTEDDTHLLVDDVHHQVFVAVDERGTEAAAATAVVMRTTSAVIAQPVVVDRPYLFVIHDVEHGTPLFVGRVTDPRG